MNKRLILVACFLTVFTAYAIRYGYGVLLPGMLDSLDISKAEAGVIYSSFFIAYTISSPVVGFLGDRWNTRWLISIFVAILGLGAFLMNYASSILAASFYFVLAGIGSSACWAPVMALAQRWTTLKNIGKTLSIIDVGSALGIIATGSLIPLVATAYDWRTGWLVLGIMGLAVAALNFFVLRDRPPEAQNIPKPEQAKQLSVKTTLSALFKDSRFWLFGLAYLLTGFSILVPFTFLSTYATKELDLSYQIGTNLLTAIGIGAIVSKVAFGSLSDKIGRIKVIMLCGVFIACGTLGMVWGQSAWLFITSLIFSLGYGVVWAMYAAAASDYFSKDSAGTTVGLWTMFLGIGSIASPIVSGWIADVTGTFMWAFVMSSGAAVLSLLLLVPIWQNRKNLHT